MSVEVISWVLNSAPVDEPSATLVLIGLANHADPDGRGAFPSAARLVEYTRLSERTVREYLDVLEAAGIITPCDPAIVAAFIKRADQRPQGWDIDITLTRDNPEHLERFRAAMNAVKAKRKARRDARAARRAADATGEQGPGAVPAEGGVTGDDANEVRPSHPVGNERGATVAGTGCDGRTSRGATVAPETSIEPSYEPSNSSHLAVGEVQQRKGGSPAGLRPGSEEEPHTPTYTIGGRTNRPASTLEAVWLAFPEELRRRVGQQASAKIAEAIREQLTYRTPEDLADRVRRRWQVWRARGEEIRHPVKLALTLLGRRHCPNVYCEDGVDLATGAACQACPDARLAQAAPSALAEPAGAVVVEMPRRRGPHDRTVAEALRRPEDPGGDVEDAPARVRRVPPCSPEVRQAALDTMRAALQAKGHGELFEQARQVVEAMPCPVCLVEAGSWCVNPATGDELPWTRQHSERAADYHRQKTNAEQAVACEPAC